MAYRLCTDEDGSKRWENPYVNGKKHGTVVYYHKDGSTNTTEWIHDTGTVMHFYEDGSKMSETPYVDGKWHGTKIRYRQDGSKWWETVYENGKMISTKRF